MTPEEMRQKLRDMVDSLPETYLDHDNRLILDIMPSLGGVNVTLTEPVVIASSGNFDEFYEKSGE